MTIHGWMEFKWKEHDLIFQDELVAWLIPHETVDKHYHIHFHWRDEKTPEFFNLTNARDNARSICLRYANRDIKDGIPQPH